MPPRLRKITLRLLLEQLQGLIDFSGKQDDVTSIFGIFGKIVIFGIFALVSNSQSHYLLISLNVKFFVQQSHYLFNYLLMVR